MAPGLLSLPDDLCRRFYGRSEPRGGPGEHCIRPHSSELAPGDHHAAAAGRAHETPKPHTFTGNEHIVARRSTMTPFPDDLIQRQIRAHVGRDRDPFYLYDAARI